MSSRAVNAAVVCLAGAVALASAASCDSYVVVGAGMAGLGAAERLLEMNASAQVTVLEARNRTGGRVYTDDSSLGQGVKFDVGASWIHDSNAEHPIQKMAARYGSVIADDGDVYEILVRGGAVVEQWQPGESDMEEWSSSGNVAARSIWGDWGATAEGHLQRARLEFDTAAADSDWSMERWVNSGEDGWGDGEMVFRDGYGTIPGNLTKELKERGVQFSLGTRVVQVTYTTEKACGGVEVLLGNGTVFKADAAIVAVPLGVLKDAVGGIKWSPALPAAHRDAISRLRFGRHGKAAIRFESDFWSSVIGQNTFAFSVEVPGATDATRGAGFQWFNLNKYLGAPVLMCFLSGEYGASLGTKTDAEVQADLLRALGAAFGASNVAAVHSFTRSRWESDPFAQGSYTVWAGMHHEAGDFEALATPVAPTLTLAGEHTHPGYFASVHGAYLSGRRAAGFGKGVADTAAAASLSWLVSWVALLAAGLLGR